jgi:hypothetical protein
MLEGLGVPIRGSNLFEYVIVQISVVPAIAPVPARRAGPARFDPLRILRSVRSPPHTMFVG